MIVLPFIYFGIWFISAYKKRGLDVFAFILLLYTFTGFCSIQLDVNDFYEISSCPKMPIGIIAPIVYIILLSLCIQPFSKFKSNSIEWFIGNINERRFNLIVYIYFAIFLIVLFVSFSIIQEILASNALADIRGEQYRGETISFYDYMRGIPRYICAICSEMASSCYIMIPFFFIGITHFNKGGILSAMTLCGSLTPLLISINIVDRSQFVYWALAFVLCLVFFHKLLSGKAKRIILILSSIVLGAMIIYFLSVTISRFADRADGTNGGLILYAGQNYLNFCNFFNNLIFDNPHKPEIVLLPNINRYILHGQSYFEFAAQLAKNYHHTVSNFSTFIGLIMSVSGFFVTFIYILVYRSVTLWAVRRNNPKVLGIKQFVYFWILVLNPVLGIFGYFYMDTSTIYAVVAWLSYGVFLSKSKRKLIVQQKIIVNYNAKQL